MWSSGIAALEGVVTAPLVTVVTPVFNAEAYIADCIESVLEQDYENWEYVVVDNRSTDGSLEIASEYATKDERVRVVAHDVPLAMLANWNRALRELSQASEYCKVLHADDWLYPECLARMVDVGERNSTAGIVGAYRLEESRVNLDGLPYWVELAPRPRRRSVLAPRRPLPLRVADGAADPLRPDPRARRVLQRGQPPRRHRGVLRASCARRTSGSSIRC